MKRKGAEGVGVLTSRKRMSSCSLTDLTIDFPVGIKAETDKALTLSESPHLGGKHYA